MASWTLVESVVSMREKSIIAEDWLTKTVGVVVVVR